MFRGYLKYQPIAVQIFAFSGLWFLLQLIYFLLVPYIIKMTTGQNLSIPEVLMASEPNAIMAINFIYQLFFFVFPVLLFAYLWSPRPLVALHYNIPFSFQLFLAIIIGFFMVTVFPVLGTLISKINISDWADNLQLERKQMEAVYFSDKTSMSLFRNLFLLALVPAVCEELFFRGILLRFINSIIPLPYLAIFISSLFFAFMHFSVYNFLPIFLAGVLLGYVFFKTGNLWLSTIMHFVYNGVQVVVQHFSQTAEDSLDNQILLLMGILFIGSSLLLFLVKNLVTSSNSLPNNWSMRFVNIEQEK